MSHSGEANRSQLFELVSTQYQYGIFFNSHLSNTHLRTILLYPATAYLVLFCNVVATSDIADFNLMKAIAECLSQTGISYPLVQLRTLYQKFLGLSQEFFNDECNALQRIPSPRLGSPLSNPVGNPFAITWGADDLVFNQFVFTGAESFSGMLSMPDMDPSLPYSFD